MGMLTVLVMPIVCIFIVELTVSALEKLGVLRYASIGAIEQLWMVLYCIALATSIAGYIIGSLQCIPISW